MTPLVALRAYAAAQGAPTGAPTPSAGVGETGGSSFADMLRNTMTETVGASRAAETQMAAQVQGRAQLVDVVTAVANAEASLETVMAIRDQVISAYQEVMRMPI